MRRCGGCVFGCTTHTASRELRRLVVEVREPMDGPPEGCCSGSAVGYSASRLDRVAKETPLKIGLRVDVKSNSKLPRLNTDAQMWRELCTLHLRWRRVGRTQMERALRAAGVPQSLGPIPELIPSAVDTCRECRPQVARRHRQPRQALVHARWCHLHAIRPDMCSTTWSRINGPLQISGSVDEDLSLHTGCRRNIQASWHRVAQASARTAFPNSRLPLLHAVSCVEGKTTNKGTAGCVP